MLLPVEVIGMREGSPAEYSEILSEVRKLHVIAGKPSARTIAKCCNLSHTSVNEILKAIGRPSWRSIEQVVTVLGGDVDTIKTMWIESMGATEAALKDPPPLSVNAQILGELRAIRALLEEMRNDRLRS